MKKLLLSIATTALLIAIFSTIDTHYERQMPSWGLWPTKAGESGNTSTGARSQPAEMIVQADEPLAIETETKPEETEQTIASQTESGQTIITIQQQYPHGLIAVFLSGVAAVLFVEVIVKWKDGETDG